MTKRSKNKGKKIFVKVFGDSHATPRYHLPQKLTQKFSHSENFYVPTFDAFGGRKIDAEFISAVKAEAGPESRLGTPKVLVLLIGSNNIRRRSQNVAKLFAEVLEGVCHVPGCHVLLVGLLPSPETDEKSRQRFSELDTQMKALAKQFPCKSSYLPLHKRFIRGGVPRIGFFRRDGIHLNTDGAQVLADTLYQHLHIMQKQVRNF